MSGPLLAFALCSLIPLTLRAASSDAPDEGGYQLKKRSSFDVPKRAASPFLPIGWLKPQETSQPAIAPAAPARPVLDEKNYNLSSILLGNPPLAVINGRSYSEGDFLRTPKPAGPVPKAGLPDETAGAGTPPPPKVQVVRIQDGVVVIRSGAERLQLPLRRKEWTPKKPDEIGSEER
jgi:hypothetical protein